MATGRNEPCPCGSGKKFKHCCEGKHNSSSSSSRLLIAAIAAVLLVAILAMMSNSREETGPARVWSPEHGHYHDASGREIPR